MNGVAYLPIRAMQRSNADFTAEVRLWRAVFAPVETTCGYVAAKSFDDCAVGCRHSTPPFLTNVSWSGRAGNQ